MNVDEMIRQVLDVVPRVTTVMTKPDEDWDPVLFVLRGGEVAVFPMDDWMYAPTMEEADAKKRMLGEVVLPRIAAMPEVEAMALVASAWTVAHTSEEVEAGGYVRPSLDTANRREVVNVAVADGRGRRGYVASIERHEDRPPTLAEWSDPGTEEGALMARAAAVLALKSARGDH